MFLCLRSSILMSRSFKDDFFERVKDSIFKIWKALWGIEPAIFCVKVLNTNHRTSPSFKPVKVSYWNLTRIEKRYFWFNIEDYKCFAGQEWVPVQSWLPWGIKFWEIIKIILMIILAHKSFEYICFAMEFSKCTKFCPNRPITSYISHTYFLPQWWFERKNLLKPWDVGIHIMFSIWIYFLLSKRTWLAFSLFL